jgi:tetratricopeptide (TPR) repeat protein
MVRSGRSALASGLYVAALAATALSATSLAAQQAPPRLAPKRQLTVGPAPGCEVVPPGQAPAARRDNAEARRLASAGQEASLVGDQTAARDAFQRAAQLNPGDERIAYDLARALEELADSTRAVSEFCRYLTLSPAGREAADVRARLGQLVPVPKQRAADNVQAQFRLGLSFYDDGRYESAVKAFDDVVRDAPKSPEGYYNRGLARTARGERAGALQDLEQYRLNAPTVDDRVEVGRAIEVLRRPVYNPASAFARSLVPGLGEFYVGHPIRGLLVLVASGAGAGMALTPQTTTETINYTDPNGVPAPYTRTLKERQYFTAGVGAAVVMTAIGMIDAVVAANKSQTGASILAPRAPRAALLPLATPRGGGLAVAVRF